MPQNYFKNLRPRSLRSRQRASRTSRTRASHPQDSGEPKTPTSRTLLFGDTYVAKHLECARSLVEELKAQGFIPMLTDTKELPGGVDCDALVYFNLPVNQPPTEYDLVPRVLIDHGASNLKWFLANARRFDFFDAIITAGPGHAASLLAFFDDHEGSAGKVSAGGFIKSQELLDPPQFSREEIARRYGLDPHEKIVLFVPTWHLSRHPDIIVAAETLAATPNHVVTLHPETRHLDVAGLNIVENVDGITTELLKHADCVVSDISSTIFEAAALGKSVIQLSLREYSDNNAVMYDFPYVAGTAHLFLGGILSRPAELSDKIAQVVEGDLRARELQGVLSTRILRDTHIDADVTSRIVEQVEQACESPRRPAAVTEDLAPVRAANLHRVHEDWFFARNRLIAHGGGDFKGHHASNSVEAARAALSAIDVVELDFVQGLDGVLVAHDTFEQRFGLSKTFAELSLEDFALGRYGGELTPYTVEQAIRECARPGKAIVCDVKATKAGFEPVAREIHRVAAENDALGRVVMQCYSVDDFHLAEEIGFERILLAVWKYFYRNPPGQEAFDFVAKCMEINESMIVAVSAPYINKHMDRPIYENPDFDRFFSFWRRLYIHGAPAHLYSSILKQNLGLFADKFAPTFEFKDLPGGFNWVEYLFLNPGLIDAGVDNQVAAVTHFLQYGRTEGRPWRYETPDDFIYSTYLELNVGLRGAGIGASHSARAHWTNFGRHEGRPYKR